MKSELQVLPTFKERRLYKKLLGVSHRLSGKHSINHQGFKTNTVLNDQCYFIKAGLESAFWTQDQGNLLTPSPVKWTYSLIYTFIHLPLRSGARPSGLRNKWGEGEPVDDVWFWAISPRGWPTKEPSDFSPPSTGKNLKKGIFFPSVAEINFLL